MSIKKVIHLFFFKNIKNIDISTTNLEIKQDPKTGFYRVSVK